MISACSFIFHSTPHPHLLRYLVPLIPEYFQNLAVQNSLLLVDSSPTRSNFTIILMLCQVSYHCLFSCEITKCSWHFFTDVTPFFILFILWGSNHFYVFIVFGWVLGTTFNPKYIFQYFHLILDRSDPSTCLTQWAALQNLIPQTSGSVAVCVTDSALAKTTDNARQGGAGALADLHWWPSTSCKLDALLWLPRYLFSSFWKVGNWGAVWPI